MQDKQQLLSYLQQGIDALIQQGHFDGGQSFRRTQKQALEAYQRFLHDKRLTVDERLEGFVSIATGLGKTAIFSGIIGATHRIAEQNGDILKSVIVVPTRPLLTQTEKDFKKFSPHMAEKVGLYGNNYKDLSQPVTIITFNAWHDLSLQGEISSENVDILISDEAHKGTSYRRVKAITTHYNSRTMRLADTATAHFDKVKSVLQSHKRQIFSKTLREAMLEGTPELAAYVQGQTVVIRVPPNDYMRSDEFEALPLRKKVAYRRALKQEMWNKYAYEIYKNGHDEHTGDLLSDNQTAFFVDGIDQANKLEALINADEELKQRLMLQERNIVSAAIHSNLSSYGEADSRFQSFRSGESGAIIGDEMFKEGFDHAPLKTVIDYSHGSIVDKAQILGRPVRSWWNETKNRSEGVTFVDTIIYIGSDDPKVDKLFEKRAKVAAVSLKEILEDTYVLNPGHPLRKPSPAGATMSGPRLFINDPNVKYYATQKDVFRLENEIEKIRRGLILTIDDIVETIDAYRETHNGKNPGQYSGEITEGLLADQVNSWNSLNSALFKGSNGLLDDPEWQKLNEKLGDGNVALRNLLIELGYKPKLSTYTIDSIIETIDAYREAHNNENPMSEVSGIITEEPLADGVSTWSALSQGLSDGRRGLVDDPKWQEIKKELDGEITLHKLLIYLGYKSANLTMDSIKKTIEAYREAHNGENPHKRSGTIMERPLADGARSWMSLDAALKGGANGLKKDTDWQALNGKLGDGNLTLPNLLIEFGYKSGRLNYTLNDVIRTIDAYRKAHKGENPIVATLRIIAEKPLADGKRTWISVNQALANGNCGLSNDPEWQKLNKKLGDGNVTLPSLLIELGYKPKPSSYTIDSIIETIYAYREAHNDKNPVIASGIITEGPLADGVRTWNALHVALLTGGNGLSADPKWQALNTNNAKLGSSGNISLGKFLDKIGYTEKITVAKIKQTIFAYRQAHSGIEPVQKSGVITEGALADKARTWASVNSALMNGSNGLSDDPEYQSLKKKYDYKFSLGKLKKEYPPGSSASPSSFGPEDNLTP